MESEQFDEILYVTQNSGLQKAISDVYCKYVHKGVLTRMV